MTHLEKLEGICVLCKLRNASNLRPLTVPFQRAFGTTCLTRHPQFAGTKELHPHLCPLEVYDSSPCTR